jgi:hypothetical protein
MKIFINERSFPERADNEDDVANALEILVRMSEGAKKLCNNHPFKRHRDLKSKEVMPGLSLSEFIISLDKSRDPKKRNLKSLFLRLFSNGPFLEGNHVDDSIVDTDGTCFKNSCFDDAAASETGAAVMSAGGSSANLYIDIISSKYGKRKILNLTSTNQISEMTWIYQANPKHEIAKDRSVCGEVYSAMTLSEAEAQKLLTNGFKCGKSVFNKAGDQWFKFHCHEKNLYHGFPINVRTPYRDYNSACQIFDVIGKNNEGQIFLELLSQ